MRGICILLKSHFGEMQQAWELTDFLTLMGAKPHQNKEYVHSPKSKRL